MRASVTPRPERGDPAVVGLLDLARGPHRDERVLDFAERVLDGEFIGGERLLAPRFGLSVGRLEPAAGVDRARDVAGERPGAGRTGEQISQRLAGETAKAGQRDPRKISARAAPISALLAISCCSASRMSGRRVSSSAGRLRGDRWPCPGCRGSCRAGSVPDCGRAGPTRRASCTAICCFSSGMADDGRFHIRPGPATFRSRRCSRRRAACGTRRRIRCRPASVSSATCRRLSRSSKVT